MMLNGDEPTAPLSPSFTGSLGFFLLLYHQRKPVPSLDKRGRVLSSLADKHEGKLASLGKGPVSEPSNTPGSMDARKLKFMPTETLTTRSKFEALKMMMFL